MSSSYGVHRLRRKRLLIAFGLATLEVDLALLLLDKRLEATGGPPILGLKSGRSELVIEPLINSTISTSL